jgi:signal peptidase I
VAPRAEPREDTQLRNPIDALTHGLPRQWRIAIDWAVTILGAVAIVLAIKAYVINPYRIPSSSMESTLHCARPGAGCMSRFSDRVLANRFIYHFREPKRGEIVVFKTPPAAQVACSSGPGGNGGDTFVKRLIALPGDRWREQDGFIYVNGQRLDEPYIEPDRRETGETIPEKTVPPDQYVMLGDNRSSSCDSRRWGTVPRKNLIGPVFAVYWPPKRIGFR